MNSRLGRLLRALERKYGKQSPPKLSGPFEMILWEIVAYLADDRRRETAFEALREKVGLTPAQILSARKGTLSAITRIGGAIAVEERAERLQAAAQLVVDEFEGDLGGVLKLAPSLAKRQLARFPMVGGPGAEKILLFSGAHPVLALDSNGVRVLSRLGIGEEHKSYAATYRSVQKSAIDELPGASCGPLTAAYLLLRRHGQETCTRNHPACRACVLNRDCRYFLAAQAAGSAS